MGDVQYAKRDDTHIAYRVLDGPDSVEIVMVSGFNFPIELLPEDPVGARLLDGLSSIGRLAIFDRRGIGLSDPIVDWERPLVDQWGDDLATVIEAAGFRRPSIFAWDVFGVARRFVGRFPDACDRLVLLGPVPSPSHDGDEWHDEFWQDMRQVTAGQGDLITRSFPTRSQDPEFRAWLDRAGRAGASPSTAARMIEANFAQLRAHPVDHSRVCVPTLVLRRPRNLTQRPDIVTRVADEIEGAIVVDLPGDDDLAIGADVDALIAEIARFLTGTAYVPPPTRSLCAILFTDLVSSTEHAAALGDERWKAVLDRHDDVARTVVSRCAGRVVKSTGDGVLAVLPSATAALQAADQIRRALADQALEVRIGIHVGELEARGDDVAGLGVHVAARVMSAAGAGEILVSATVPAVTVGSAVAFESRGPHQLKGVPGEWELFAAVDPAGEPISS
ncbi:MAG TPA: adenylate/guanylate cyclase domain-containing protein [Acidimicrobiia bacterium]|nr:adenylate/guanylate cyclase domain-containing protein [Acidimicrobiia bacterium]